MSSQETGADASWARIFKDRARALRPVPFTSSLSRITPKNPGPGPSTFIVSLDPLHPSYQDPASSGRLLSLASLISTAFCDPGAAPSLPPRSASCRKEYFLCSAGRARLGWHHSFCETTSGSPPPSFDCFSAFVAVSAIKALPVDSTDSAAAFA